MLPRPPKPADIAVLQYTSGSTSDPRGVAVTHANLAHNLATITSEFQPSVNARLLSWLPHFHDMGLIWRGAVAAHLGWRIDSDVPAAIPATPAALAGAIRSMELK